MKKVITFFIAFLIFKSDLLADITKLKVDGRVRYFTTLVDDLGTRYDDTRPGPALDLHFTYPLTDNLSITVLVLAGIIMLRRVDVPKSY